jgi:tetratricopeptide (TPR) repeat protein
MVNPRSTSRSPGLRAGLLLLGLLGLASASLAESPIPVSPARAAPADSSSFAAAEAAFLAHPTDRSRARAYRQAARRAGQSDSAIACFRRTLTAHPGAQGIRFELALTHIDRVPSTPKLDLGKQGIHASQAIRLFTEILAAEPENWAARYARGMAHLLYPRPTKHYEPAAEDFLRLLELQRTLPPAPHFARTFVALGDAYVLDLRLQAARTTWETGKKLFPSHPELPARLAIEVSELEAAIVPLYGFERPFDTDLDCLWAP